MTDSESNLPEPFAGQVRDPRLVAPQIHDFHVSELAAENAGSMSPFGDDVEFPLPPESLGYQHPRAQDRPNLAGK